MGKLSCTGCRLPLDAGNLQLGSSTGDYFVGEGKGIRPSGIINRSQPFYSLCRIRGKISQGFLNLPQDNKEVDVRAQANHRFLSTYLAGDDTDQGSKIKQS